MNAGWSKIRKELHSQGWEQTIVKESAQGPRAQWQPSFVPTTPQAEVGSRPACLSYLVFSGEVKIALSDGSPVQSSENCFSVHILACLLAQLADHTPIPASLIIIILEDEDILSSEFYITEQANAITEIQTHVRLALSSVSSPPISAHTGK